MLASSTCFPFIPLLALSSTYGFRKSGAGNWKVLSSPVLDCFMWCEQFTRCPLLLCSSVLLEVPVDSLYKTRTRTGVLTRWKLCASPQIGFRACHHAYTLERCLLLQNLTVSASIYCLVRCEEQDVRTMANTSAHMKFTIKWLGFYESM